MVGPICRVEGKMNAVMYRGILESTMLPHAVDKMPAGWIFQQDNDPKHTATLLMGTKPNAKKPIPGWFKDNDVKVLPWPAQSPDLNPIEHLWGEVDRRLNGEKFKKEADLMNALVREWSKIPVDRIVKLVDSMPSRCAAVIKANGNATKY